MKTEKLYTPHIRVNDNVTKVMLDVVLALTPSIVIAYLVYGLAPVLVILTSVLSAICAEWIFGFIFLGKNNTVIDLSAVVTGILLGMTLAPFTPLYVVAFGATMAVIFGKMVFSGLGKNIFNPALIGREFMVVFFPTIMSSGSIWFSKEALNISSVKVFSLLGNIPLLKYLDRMILTPSGAIGEFSVFFLVVGGIYLLLKDRISWHIPVTLFITVLIGQFLLFYMNVSTNLSIGGLMLAGIFMATDMPSSPSTNSGKIYYGIMMGIAVTICCYQGIRFEMLSYSILLMNAFANIINETFVPRIFGMKNNWLEKSLKGLGIAVLICGATYGLTVLHHLELVKYLLYFYILNSVIDLILSDKIK